MAQKLLQVIIIIIIIIITATIHICKYLVTLVLFLRYILKLVL